MYGAGSTKRKHARRLPATAALRQASNIIQAVRVSAAFHQCRRDCDGLPDRGVSLQVISTTRVVAKVHRRKVVSRTRVLKVCSLRSVCQRRQAWKTRTKQASQASCEPSLRRSYCKEALRPSPNHQNEKRSVWQHCPIMKTTFSFIQVQRSSRVTQKQNCDARSA